jgi:IclR family acetate operon transcriptional repressor
MSQKPYTVQPIVKALRLLEAVAWKGHDVRLTEITKELDLPKTTTFRYLQTLSAAGYIRHDAKNDRYGIGPRLRMFAGADNMLAELRRAAQPKMQDLAQQFNATINLAISSGLDIVYVGMENRSSSMSMRARIGEHHPLHSTAVGKAIMAFLPPGELAAILDSPLNEMTVRTIQSIAVLRRQLSEARKLGYSLDREETENGISCLGVPILDAHGYPIAALSLAAPDRRLIAMIGDASLALQTAARTIQLGD